MQGSQPLLGVGESMRGGHRDGAGDAAKNSADTEICYIIVIICFPSIILSPFVLILFFLLMIFFGSP
jgi:hypothetical protein